MSVALRVITRLQDLDDVSVELGAGVDGAALVYDHASGQFETERVLSAVLAGDGPNLVFDPYQRGVSFGAGQWGGRERWIGGGHVTNVSADTQNPIAAAFGSGYTFRSDGFPIGKRLWLDESGIKTSSNTYWLMIYGRAPAGTTYAAFLTGYTAVGAATFSTSGTAAVATGLPQVWAARYVIPARTAYVNIYLARTAGATTTFDIYAMCLFADSGANVWDQLLPPAQPDCVNRYQLRNWQAQVAKVLQADGSSQAVVAFVGDSWVDNLHIWTPLGTWLRTQYGDAGVGWCSACAPAGGSLPSAPTGVTCSRTGTWSDVDQTSSARGVDLAHATCMATGGTLVFSAAVHGFTLHYLKQANGGVFRWNVDGSGWTTVDTANASNLFATVAVTGLDGNAHTLNIEVTTAGTAGVTLMGCDCMKTGNGVRVHKLGNGGAAASQFTGVDATIWQAGLAALATDVVIVLLGTNDCVANVSPATFNASLTTMAARVRAALPYCDVLFLSPCDMGLGPYTYAPQNYADEMRSVAITNRCGYVDAHRNFGSYADAAARGLWANTSHLNAVGGQLVANLMIEQALRVR